MAKSDRDANGRFREGVCPNPNGRPRKPKLDARQQLIAILEEEVLAGSQSMTMLEALFRTYCKEAIKDPRLFSRLLPLLLVAPGVGAGSTRDVNPEDDHATIEAFRQAERERASRERAAMKPVSDDADD